MESVTEPIPPLNRNAYPRAGDVALLCEGDLIGYEASLLKKWLDFVRPADRLVDVWPCGTSESIFGIADAIGRTVPLLVLEDRDFRTTQETETYCKERKRDRSDRGLSILDWLCWRRNEIENYFLDEDVIVPVMQKAFGCTEEQVKTALGTAIELLIPFQALQYAYFETRKKWEKTDPSSYLLPQCRPQWGENGLEAIDIAKLESEIRKKLEAWRKSLSINADILVKFNELIEMWRNSPQASIPWRADWAGKEILKFVRQQLCALSAGWWSVDKTKPVPVDWKKMKNNRARNAYDREIERKLSPDLVNHFVDVLKALRPEDPRRNEFDALTAALAR